MKTPRSPFDWRPRAALLAFLALGAAAFAAPACGNNNAAPPTTSSTGAGASTTAGTGASTTASGTGGSTTTTGTGGSDAGPACVPDGGATGCYSCPPATNAEFLNACAANDQCAHFDNATRLPAWDGGALPPVP